MQAAGDLVGVRVELAAGVKFRKDDLDRRTTLLLHHAHGDAAAVVGNGCAAVGIQDDLDRVGVARECLVDGVVDDLGKQLMETVDAGAALYIHRRTLAYSLEALE